MEGISKGRCHKYTELRAKWCEYTFAVNQNVKNHKISAEYLSINRFVRFTTFKFNICANILFHFSCVFLFYFIYFFSISTLFEKKLVAAHPKIILRTSQMCSFLNHEFLFTPQYRSDFLPDRLGRNDSFRES